MRMEGAVGKQIKNLSLDPEAVARGERYSRMHGTNLSQLVSNFLASLPTGGEEAEQGLSPAVRRLLGAVRQGSAQDYHDYLRDKYAR
jgi:hypothetical protein